MSERRPTVAAVLNTLDEERRIAYALRSVRPWVDEIVVVDMESTDRTAEIARSFGARVVAHPRVGFVEPARAFACAQTSADWIVVLDADELVPPALARRLLAIARADEADAVRVPRVNHLLGAPLLHSGWNPERDRHLRFFKRGAVDLPERIHQHIAPRPGARQLDLADRPGEALVHLSHVDAAAFLDKLNRYTTIEAEQALARGERPPTALGALKSAAREWAARYLRHGGWRDGWRGFYLSLFMAGYRLAIAAKQTERAEVGTRDDVERGYARVAEEILASYDTDAAADARDVSVTRADGASHEPRDAGKAEDVAPKGEHGAGKGEHGEH